MKNLLIIISLSLALFACNKNEEETNTPINYFENGISLRVQSTDSTDLLDDANNGHYKKSDISILESHDLANAISIYKYTDTNYYYLDLKLNYPKPHNMLGDIYNENLITKVIFNNNDVDEIKGLFEIEYHTGNDSTLGAGSGYTIILKEAWYNGKVIYKRQTEENNSDWELPIITKELNDSH